MTKTFKERLMRELVVDTKKYRYAYLYSSKHERFIIERLPIEYLDTTAAYTEWEVIA